MDFVPSSQSSQDGEDLSAPHFAGTSDPFEDASLYQDISGAAVVESVGSSEPFEDGEEDLRLPMVCPHLPSVVSSLKSDGKVMRRNFFNLIEIHVQKFLPGCKLQDLQMQDWRVNSSFSMRKFFGQHRSESA